MTESIWQILSGILLFSNGLPWFMIYRAEQKKKHAEANRAVSENDQLRLDMQQDQFDYLNDLLSKCLVDNADAREQLTRKTSEYLDKILELRREYSEKLIENLDEINRLKSKITFYRYYRCYDTECKNRILNHENEEHHG